jgi:hypothetical protein
LGASTQQGSHARFLGLSAMHATSTLFTVLSYCLPGQLSFLGLTAVSY